MKNIKDKRSGKKIQTNIHCHILGPQINFKQNLGER